MTVEKIKQLISESLLLKVVLSAMLVALLGVYFKAFFTTGVNFEDTFLKKEVVASDSHYRGTSAYGGIHITVKGTKNGQTSAEVVYRLPNNIDRQYTVNFKTAGDRDSGIENIMDEQGTIVFEGQYVKDSMFLLDKDGNPMIPDDFVNIRINGETPFTSEYTVSLKNVADMASFANDTIRGKYEFLIIALVIFVFTAIDIKFPLFFFTMRNFLEVRDPEPSDFYLAMQRASWYISPVIILILMIVAIA